MDDQTVAAGEMLGPDDLSALMYGSYVSVLDLSRFTAQGRATAINYVLKGGELRGLDRQYAASVSLGQQLVKVAAICAMWLLAICIALIAGYSFDEVLVPGMLGGFWVIPAAAGFMSKVGKGIGPVVRESTTTLVREAVVVSKAVVDSRHAKVWARIQSSWVTVQSHAGTIDAAALGTVRDLAYNAQAELALAIQAERLGVKACGDDVERAVGLLEAAAARALDRPAVRDEAARARAVGLIKVSEPSEPAALDRAVPGRWARYPRAPHGS